MSRTGAAEQLGQAVSRLYTSDGGGSLYRSQGSTRRRGSAVEKAAKYEVYEVKRILNLPVESYQTYESRVEWVNGQPTRIVEESGPPMIEHPLLEDRRTRRRPVTDEELLLLKGAADQYCPPTVHLTCNIRTHREVCSRHKACLCQEYGFPERDLLFEGIKQTEGMTCVTERLDPLALADAREAELKRREQALVDMTMIRILQSKAKAEAERWRAVRRVRRSMKPVRMHARDAWMLGECSWCGETVELLDPIYLDRDSGAYWHARHDESEAVG